MLEAYLSDPEAGRTISSLIVKVAASMRSIKEESETLEYECLTDEAFQQQIAALCVYVSRFEHYIAKAEKGVERFIDNAFMKWQACFELQQDVLRLLSLFNNASKVNTATTTNSSSTTTTTTASLLKSISALTQYPKIEQTSNFNVIKINAHAIEIQYKNKALVIPDASRPNKTGDNSPDPLHTTVLEFLQPGVARETVMVKITETVKRFDAYQDNMRVCQSHYAALGNRLTLCSERALLYERLDETSEYINDTVQLVSAKSILVAEIASLKIYFDEMLEILEQECGNCREYMFNIVNRFTECRTSYTKLLVQLRLHQVTLECLEESQPTSLDTNATCCSSMY